MTLLAVRLSTEPKAAFKTTEFIAYVAADVGVLAAAAIVDATDFGSQDAWFFVSLSTIGYMVSRAWPSPAAATSTTTRFCISLNLPVVELLDATFADATHAAPEFNGVHGAQLMGVLGDDGEHFLHQTHAIRRQFSTT